MKNYIHCNENAVYYECGYSNDNCIYISLGSDGYFLTDGRYATDAQKKLSNTKLVVVNDLLEKAAKIISKNKINKINFDPREWSYFDVAKLKSTTKAKWTEKVSLSHNNRIIKSSDEIKLLTKAVKIGAMAFDDFAGMVEFGGIGMSEHELFGMALEAMRGSKARDLSFDPIVAVGKNAAKPHAHPTKKRVAIGDLLLLDAGIKYKRYCSDRTRTVQIKSDFEFSTQQVFTSKKIQKAYDAVLKAHDKAISQAKSGMKAKKIDALARETIGKAGFGKYFVHSTGHGVGLDIHEMPYISSRSDTKIEDGMVFTIEPGIYIPGQFGIRIEDMVVMKNGRAEIL